MKGNELLEAELQRLAHPLRSKAEEDKVRRYSAIKANGIRLTEGAFKKIEGE